MNEATPPGATPADRPELVIPLRDGTELRIGPAGVRNGERLFEIARLQDARQVAPDPETIALRVAGAGLVEFQPARAGDGGLALEAIFRLRPELRPAGFGSPSAPPLYGPPAYGPPGTPPYPPGMYPPPGYAPSGYPPPYPGYSGGPPPNPNTGTGRVTPVPRGIGEVISAAFDLYFASFWTWLRIGLAVAFVPLALVGVMVIVFFQALGLNPWGSAFTAFIPTQISPSGTPTFPTLPTIDPTTWLILGGLALAFLVASFFFGAWQIAALGIAAREALLGRPVRVGASLGRGLRRLMPVLGTSLLISLLTLPLGVLAVAAFEFGFFGLIVGSSTSLPNSTVLLVGFIAGVLSIPLYIGFIYVQVRLSLAPYIAATERRAGTGAIGKSWQLTRGNWWRTFVPVFVVGLAAGFVANFVTPFFFISLAFTFLVVYPIVLALTAPLSVIAYTAILHDLRLRREGYAAVVQGDAPSGAPGAQPG